MGTISGHQKVGIRGVPIPLGGARFGLWVVTSRTECPADRKYREPWWLCRCDCGTERAVSGKALRDGSSTSCGCRRREIVGSIARQRRGASHPNWNGGRTSTVHGYVRVRDKEARRYVMEHRAVIANVIGRELLPTETVHHKNGIRDDNRPENLELRSGAHGPHQSVEDLIAFAVDVLSRYAPDMLASPHSSVA